MGQKGTPSGFSLISWPRIKRFKFYSLKVKYEGRSKSLNHSIIVLKLLIRNFHVKLYNTLSMNVQNLEVLALLFFDIVTIARSTLLPSVFPAYKSVFKEIGRALSDPRLHCRLDSVIMFKLLASQIVLQRSKHVKI